MDSHKKIAKNTAWLFGGQITGRLIRAAIIIYAARVLGAASWGAFSYALSVAAFLTIFADTGINGLLVREGNKNPHMRDQYLATAFFIKLVLVSLLGITALILSPFLSTLPETKQLFPIVLLVFVFDSFRDFVLAIARSLERMEIEGIVIILTNVAIAGLGCAALLVQRTSISLAYAYAIGTGIGLIAAIIPLRKYFKNLFANFKLSLISHIFASAWTFGLVSIMGAVMIDTDIIMLGWMVPETAVGLYAASQKLVQLIYITPALITTAFFPQIAKRAAESKELFRSLFEQALKIIFLLAFPLTIGGILAGRHIITFLYGQAYTGGGMTFIILAATFITVFPGTLITNALFVFSEQKKLFSYVVLGVIGNIVFNILFIKALGIEGAALSTLCNQLAINIYAWYKLRTIVPFTIFRNLKKIIASSVGMGIITYLLLLSHIHVILVIIISALSYFALLLALRETIIKKIYTIITKR
ncbi:MAG: flippase [bacterium]